MLSLRKNRLSLSLINYSFVRIYKKIASLTIDNVKLSRRKVLYNIVDLYLSY